MTASVAASAPSAPAAPAAAPVTVAAVTGAAASAAPAPSGEIVLAQAAPAGQANAVPVAAPPAAVPGPAQLPAFGRLEVLDPPGPAEARAIQIQPGMRIVLPDAAFDPARAKYQIVGKDLVIQTDNGGTVTLDDFFLLNGAPPTLSVHNMPPQPANILLAAAVTEADQTLVMPAAGESATTTVSGGNASFSPFVPGDIGPGLNPLGPLGPTALSYGADFNIIRTDPSGNGSGEDDGKAAPVITTTTTIDTVIVDKSVGFTPPTTPPFPGSLDGVGEGVPLPDSAINGLDPRLVTLDAEREVSIVFQSEIGMINSSVGAYIVAPDGTLTQSQVIFPVVNSFDQSQWFQDGKGPLSPGDSVSLGKITAGSQVGMFFIQAGADGAGPDLASGTIEIRDPTTGAPANINTLTGPPVMVHIATDGTETVISDLVYYTSDPDPSSAAANPLNPFGLTQVVSGWNTDIGAVLVGFEDLAGPLGHANITDKTPLGALNDRDFNDAIFNIVFGEANDGTAIFETGDNASLLADITDKDSVALKAATVELSAGAKAGDGLGILAASDANGDGVIDGTTISYTQVSDTELSFSGNDTLANYAVALDAIRFTNDSGDIESGVRSISTSVTDDTGKTSGKAVTNVNVNKTEIQLGEGNDTYSGSDAPEAIAGNGGHDTLFGLGGDDFLNGGNGIDELNGGDGNDTLAGMTGPDVLIGGAGADTFVFTALGDARDEILDLNLAEGDRIDLERLFQGTAFDPDAANASDWLQFHAITADPDGQANDLSVEVDLDGSGSLYGMTHIMVAYDVGNIDAVTIQSATTFGNQAAV